MTSKLPNSFGMRTGSNMPLRVGTYYAHSKLCENKLLENVKISNAIKYYYNTKYNKEKVAILYTIKLLLYKQISNIKPFL